MTNIICGLCRGSQNLAWASSKKRMWMTCPACEGRGVEEIFEPRFIIMKGFDVDINNQTVINTEGTIIISIKECPTKAELGVKLGKFPSLTQARKNNWKEPLALGSFFLKNVGNIEVVE